MWHSRPPRDLPPSPSWQKQSQISILIIWYPPLLRRLFPNWVYVFISNAELTRQLLEAPWQMQVWHRHGRHVVQIWPKYSQFWNFAYYHSSGQDGICVGRNRNNELPVQWSSSLPKWLRSEIRGWNIKHAWKWRRIGVRMFYEMVNLIRNHSLCPF